MEITYDEWLEQYMPLVDEDGNPLEFETYGEAYKLITETDPSFVWTRRDDGEVCYISSGRHWVNRDCYFITSVPFTEDVIVPLYEYDAGDFED